MIQNDPIGPVSGYVPYFYQAGLYRVSPAANRTSKPSIDGQFDSYDFSLGSHTTDRLDHFPSVEQIIRSGYFAAPKRDPVSAILDDRHDTAWLGLDDIIGQVRRRYEIFEESITQIELAKCAAANAIYTHEAYVGPADSSQMEKKHRTIQGLYEQQRDEQTTLWKDVSRLRILLPESVQTYLSAYRKRSILGQEPGDSP